MERADDLGAEFDTRADLCRTTVLEQPDIQFLVHVNMRRPNLVIDRLVDGDGDGSRRESYLRIARAVDDEMRALDRNLQHFRAGSLIRLVLQGPRGAILANSIFLDEYVMATVGLNAEAAPPAGIPSQLANVSHVDKAVSALVDRIRALVGQPSLNPGGWLENPPHSEPVRPISAEAIHEEIMHPEGSGALEIFRNAVASGALQYAALFRGRDQLLQVDAFESNGIKQFLTRITPQIRRENYREFGLQAEEHVAELARLTSFATGAPLLRVVFDVEQGAIIYYRVGEDRHLIGMTLDQSAVREADDEARNLVLKCR
jgi:hypothetical protein